MKRFRRCIFYCTNNISQIHVKITRSTSVCWIDLLRRVIFVNKWFKTYRSKGNGLAREHSCLFVKHGQIKVLPVAVFFVPRSSDLWATNYGFRNTTRFVVCWIRFQCVCFGRCCVCANSHDPREFPKLISYWMSLSIMKGYVNFWLNVIFYLKSFICMFRWSWINAVQDTFYL